MTLARPVQFSMDAWQKSLLINYQAVATRAQTTSVSDASAKAISCTTNLNKPEPMNVDDGEVNLFAQESLASGREFSLSKESLHSTPSDLQSNGRRVDGCTKSFG